MDLKIGHISKLQTNADLAEVLIKEVSKCLFKPKPEPEPELEPEPVELAGNPEDLTKYLNGVQCALNFFDHTLERPQFSKIYENFKPIIVRAAKNMKLCIRDKSGAEQRK